MSIACIATNLIKMNRIGIRFAACPPVLQSVNKLSTTNRMSAFNKVSTSPFRSELNVSPLILKQYDFTACKAYSTKQPELPSKQELEKYFFKVTVVVWDLLWTIVLWSWAMCRKHIINNPTVQSYWNTFNRKLDEARKN